MWERDIEETRSVMARVEGRLEKAGESQYSGLCTCFKLSNLSQRLKMFEAKNEYQEITHVSEI